MQLLRKTACYIDFDILDKNLEVLRANVPTGQEIMIVIKADGYGHGAPQMMKHFLKRGVNYFAVAALNEALEARRVNKEGNILILGWTPNELLHIAAENNITLNVFSYEQAKILSDLGINAKIHIKVDTGMNRLGFLPTEESADEVKRIAELPSLNVEGIFSHLAQLNADTDEAQYRKFDAFLKMCEERGVHFKLRHLANGKSAIKYPHMRYDMLRSGSVITGFCLNMPNIHTEVGMSVRTVVARIHKVPAGEGMGYDLLDAADHDRLIATLPFGYADGMPKSLSNHAGWVVIRGKKAEICGGICMDMCMVDVTDVEGVSVGDDVLIYGGGEGAMDLFDVRAISGVGLSNLQIAVHKRVPRVYIEDGKVIEICDIV